MWKKDLATVSQHAADSLADPEEYEDMFPDFQSALKAEEAFKKAREQVLGASAAFSSSSSASSSSNVEEEKVEEKVEEKKVKAEEKKATEEKNDSKDKEDDDDGFLEELENEVGDVTGAFGGDDNNDDIDLDDFEVDDF
tara:strand:- start:1295 stop:1711 length:417 start_codon:yes stop_codon:yes gene_type:complete